MLTLFMSQPACRTGFVGHPCTLLTAVTLQERLDAAVNDAFLRGGNPPRLFSNVTFQRLVAEVNGVNRVIQAPVLAFIAYKLANLLVDPSWNVLGRRLESSENVHGYLQYLDMAIAQKGITITATIPAETEDDEEPRTTWIRIDHDMDVRWRLLARVLARGVKLATLLCVGLSPKYWIMHVGGHAIHCPSTNTCWRNGLPRSCWAGGPFPQCKPYEVVVCEDALYFVHQCWILCCGWLRVTLLWVS